MDDNKEKLSFEQALEELEDIVSKMERGEMSLEDSVDAYARGMELMNLCRSKLSAAEQRIKKLEADGTLTECEEDGTAKIKPAVRSPRPAKTRYAVADDQDIPF